MNRVLDCQRRKRDHFGFGKLLIMGQTDDLKTRSWALDDANVEKVDRRDKREKLWSGRAAVLAGLTAVIRRTDERLRTRLGIRAANTGG